MLTLNFIGYIIVLVAVSDSSVIKPRSLPDPPRIVSSKRNEMPPKHPNIPSKDKKLSSKLVDEDFGLYKDYGGEIPVFPPEYDYTNTLDKDFEGKDFIKPGRKPEIHPVNNHGDKDEDGRVHEESDEDIDKPVDFDSEEDDDEPIDHGHGDHSEEDEIHKDMDYYGSGDSFDAEEHTEKPTDLGGEPDDEHFDEDRHKDIDESHDEDDVDKDIDVPHDDEDEEDEEDDDVSDIDKAIAESSYGGFVFDTPFFNVRQVTKYFQQLEKALEQVFRQSLDEAVLLNGTYANTTEEEIDINGKKYLVQKSIIHGRDNHSSIYVEALSKMPAKNETEEVKDSGI